jgi:hypothetical protein
MHTMADKQELRDRMLADVKANIEAARELHRRIVATRDARRTKDGKGDHASPRQ